MGYTAPTTRATGYLVTAANWNTDLVDNITFLANPPACRVYNSANQSVAHITVTASSYDSERYDTDNMHSTSLNTSRITCNTAGLYNLTFTGAIALGTDYTMVIALLRLNGATYIAKQTVGSVTVADDHVNLNVATVYKLAVTDYVEAVVFHRNGAAAARNLVAAGNFTPELAATWVGIG